MLDVLMQAQNKIGTAAPVGKLIAELNFGFWVDLTGARYDFVWRNSLHKAFPYAHVSRKMVHGRLHSGKWREQGSRCDAAVPVIRHPGRLPQIGKVLG